MFLQPAPSVEVLSGGLRSLCKQGDSWGHRQPARRPRCVGGPATCFQGELACPFDGPETLSLSCPIPDPAYPLSRSPREKSFINQLPFSKSTFALVRLHTNFISPANPASHVWGVKSMKNHRIYDRNWRQIGALFTQTRQLPPGGARGSYQRGLRGF